MKPQNKPTGPIVREVQVRAITDKLKENRQAEFVISTEAPDTWGTVFMMDGWELERYQRNPVVLYAHKSYSDNPDVVIGTSEVFRDGNELIGRVTFEAAEDNPLAEKVMRKVYNGTLRMASIGADPKEAHWGDFDKGENPDLLYFTRQELLEWSIVPIGSNPDAVKRSAERIEEFKNEVQRDPTPETDNDKKELSIRKAQVIINKNRCL